MIDFPAAASRMPFVTCFCSLGCSILALFAASSYRVRDIASSVLLTFE